MPIFGRMQRYTDGRPVEPLPPPPQTPTAPAPDPFAVTRQYSGVGDYSSDIQRQTAYGTLPPGPNPLETLDPVQHPRGPGWFVDPFNPEGGAISRSAYATLKGQFGMMHRASPQVQANQYKEKVLAGKAGAEGHAPNPVRDLLTGTVKPNDEVMILHPEVADPATLAIWKADNQKIRADFARMMTNNTGELTLDDFMDMGDQLTMQYPDNDGFIRNMMQSEMRKNPKLKAEFDQYRLTGESESMGAKGNAAFQQLKPQEQELLRAQIQGATQPGGFIHPDLAAKLGYPVDKDTGEIRIPGPDGKFISPTASDIAARAQTLYGIGAPPAAMPAAAPATGTISGASVGPEIVGKAGITGVARGPRGTVVSLQDGRQIEEKNAQVLIDTMRARNTPEHNERAALLEKAFGLKPPVTTKIPKVAPAVKGVPKESVDDTAGFIRRDAQGNTKIWDFKTKTWQVLVDAERRKSMVETLESDKDIFDVFAAAASKIGRGFSAGKAKIKSALKESEDAWKANQ